VKGNEGFSLQSIAYETGWTEWSPGRGATGPVDKHTVKPDDAYSAPDPSNASKTIWTRPNGNTVEFTVVHYFRRLDDDTLWRSFHKSAGITTIKAFNGLLKMQVGPNSKALPIWGSYWTATTWLRSNSFSSWYDWQFTVQGKYPDKDGPDEAAMLRGLELYQALGLPEITPTPKLAAAAPAAKKITFTSGIAPASEETPKARSEQPPPPEAYDGPGDFDDPTPW
jgi:hypothetical protein